jgi:hypothetical protein
MMEAASTSETSVNFYQTTRRNIPEDSHFRVFFSSQVLEVYPGRAVTAQTSLHYQ